MKDTLTLLETLGPLLTKTFSADGKVIPYGDAKNMKVKEVEITGWPDLIELLQSLHKKPKRCLIRGKRTGEESERPGTFVRQNANFSDQPLHWLMVDVDGFEPAFAAPTDPAAVDEYIEAVLPAFKGASYYWHMSSSAGQSPKLKCHIHFLLATPYTCSQLTAWAKSVGPQVDSALYRRVQVHYTADPIFEGGRVDPITKRAGFVQGDHDFVDLTISAEARETGAGEGGNDMKLVDPSAKDGIIGLFHNVFDAEDVLLTLLEGEFVQVSDRRYTWVNGGGTPEGVWIHDDSMHVGASHNTWPINGIANLWDLVRVFKFGHLDPTEEDFETLDQQKVGHRPSDQAMIEWAKALPEMVEAQREERSAEVTRLRGLITTAQDIYALTTVANTIQESDLLVLERDQLASTFFARSREFGSHLSRAEINRMMRPGRRNISRALPDWAKPWVWVNADDGFLNVETKQVVSERSFNAMYDRRIPLDQDGNRPRAAAMVLNEWGMTTVDARMYFPSVDQDVFQLNGLHYANTFRMDLMAQMPSKLTPSHRRAIKIVEEHAALLIPSLIERTLFLDYLAFCVQNPGVKVRWAPLLKGVEGDGKSAFITMMGHILGKENVRVLDSSTLEKSSFTNWRVGQCFTGVEEMKLHGHNRYDVFNMLKTPLSNDSIEVHSKGKDPITYPNTTNYLLLTNFDDGVPINDNDRRIFFLRSPFLTKEDLEMVVGRDGKYFDALFDFAIKEHAGALRKWLMERELSPDFKPNGRAPGSDARQLAVDLSRRDDDDAITTILEDGGFGVYSDLIAVACLNDILLNKYGIKLNTGRVKAVLASYGYSQWGENQARWRGQSYRWYFRGERPVSPGVVAERLETERIAKQTEADFAD